MVVDLPELREKLGVFKDRQDAGIRLAEMLQAYRDSSAIVFAIPAGGVPVAATLAEKLNLSLDVAVVSKITLPWNTEAGFGAVAFDGTVRLNNRMLGHIGLTDQEVRQRIELTTVKVQKRFKELRGAEPMPDLSGRKVFLVDDGIASGFTFRVAVEALKNHGTDEIIAAVPTGHRHALQPVAPQVQAVYCANVRSGWSFAVAAAYQRWSDVDDAEVLQILTRFRGRRGA
ncbi:MAG: phosphoribosyltransferase [Planctomycetota bacterium]|nr:MAG: phosphoribosyltransferase [Planctomycetota bacterium]